MSETELTAETISHRSIKGGIALTFRRILLKTLSWGTFIALGWILDPIQFGIIGIVSSVIDFFAYFSDVGLAAAIVQQKEKLTTKELRTIFTIQLILVSTVTFVIVLLAPILVQTIFHKQLSASNGMLIQLLGLSLIFASLKSIPSALLERQLHFNKLVIPEVIETIIYNSIVLILAWQGLGVWSFVWASLARGLVGTVITFVLCPWSVGFALDRNSIHKLFSFGLPFQLNSFIALLKDKIVPLYLGARLGSEAVGYIGWAQKYAYLPLEILNDIIRVTFPAYARLQHDPQLLKKALEKSLYLISLTLYPLLAGLIALMPWITQYMLNPKWIPALPVFYLLCFNTAWASISTTFTNALFAIGQSKIVLKYMVIWTVLTWTLVPAFTIYSNSILGLGYAQALIAFTSIGIIWEIKRIIPIKILPHIFINATCATIMAIIIYFTSQLYVSNTLHIFIQTFFGATIYMFFIYTFSKARFTLELSSIIKKLRKN